MSPARPKASPRAWRGARRLLALALIAGPAAAATPEKQACVDAATRGQIQRDDLKLGAAIEAFTLCASSSCPAAVRRSCSEWLEDARAKIPKVRIRVVGASRVTRVEIDGAVAAEGSPVALDPGRHTLRVEAEGRPAHERDFSLRPGDDETLEVEMSPPPGRRPAPPAARPAPALFWVLGGVAVVGLASWAGFGLAASAETDRLQAECAPGCSAADRDGAFRTALVADVSLGLGALAAVGAAVVWFTRPSRPAQPSALRPGGWLALEPGPR